MYTLTLVVSTAKPQPVFLVLTVLPLSSLCFIQHWNALCIPRIHFILFHLMCLQASNPSLTQTASTQSPCGFPQSDRMPPFLTKQLPVLIWLELQPQGYCLLPTPTWASLQLGCPAESDTALNMVYTLKKCRSDQFHFMGHKSKAKKSEMICHKIQHKSVDTRIPYKPLLILLFSFY